MSINAGVVIWPGPGQVPVCEVTRCQPDQHHRGQGRWRPDNQGQGQHRGGSFEIVEIFK